tara:strand:+ start:1585 stop:1848 length:264 start_codon:yes stop_codon:yes gene_type:complete
MTDDIFDFGFTAVTEEELDTVQQLTQKSSDTQETADAVQNKIDKLYNAVVPLLNNLKKNPEKDYIHWPNRLDKVEQFEDMLTKIYKS